MPGGAHGGGDLAANPMEYDVFFSLARDQRGTGLLPDGLVGLLVSLLATTMIVPIYASQAATSTAQAVNASRTSDLTSLVDASLPSARQVGASASSFTFADPNTSVTSPDPGRTLEITADDPAGQVLERDDGGRYQVRVWAQTHPDDDGAGHAVAVMASAPKKGQSPGACLEVVAETRHCLVAQAVVDSAIGGVRAPNLADPTLNAAARAGDGRLLWSSKGQALPQGHNQMRYLVALTSAPAQGAKLIVRATSTGTGEYPAGWPLVHEVDLAAEGVSTAGMSGSYISGSFDIRHMRDLDFSVAGASHDQAKTVVFTADDTSEEQ